MTWCLAYENVWNLHASLWGWRWGQGWPVPLAAPFSGDALDPSTDVGREPTLISNKESKAGTHCDRHTAGYGIHRASCAPWPDVTPIGRSRNWRAALSNFPRSCSRKLDTNTVVSGFWSPVFSCEGLSTLTPPIIISCKGFSDKGTWAWVPRDFAVPVTALTKTNWIYNQWRNYIHHLPSSRVSQFSRLPHPSPQPLGS